MEKCSIADIYSRALFSLLIATVSFSFYAATATPVQAVSDPVVYVNPQSYNASHIGEIFQVSLAIRDVSIESGLIGAEFKLQYDRTLLETREEWIIEGNFFKNIGGTFFEALVETDALDQKYIHAFVILLPSANGTYSDFPSGSGTIATIVFNVTYRPVEPLQASCELNVYDTILVDSEVNVVSHTTVDGLFRVASLVPPTLEVAPDKYSALRLGEVFDVDVKIEDVDRDWRLTGLQFRLQYNGTLLEPEVVTEGGFFEAYGDTWFQAIVEQDSVIVGVMVLPGAGGVWPEPFPEGDGTVATVRFKSVYQPIVPLSSSSCPLALTEVILVDDESEQVPNDVSDGEFEIVAAEAGIDRFRPIDVQVDVGSVHFNGEIADFYILVTDYGKAVNPDGLRCVVYFEGAESLNVTSGLEHVAKGLYRLPYTIPAGALPGTYALVVEADYLQASGSAVKSFLVSSTLKGWNTDISSIKANVATVIIPSLGQIRLDLAAVNATLLEVRDDVATVGTALGNLTTDVGNLNATLIRVEGKVATVQTSLGTLQGTVETIEDDTATVKTDVGTVKAKVSSLQTSMDTSTNLLYVTLVLALIAAVAAVIVVFKTFKKRP